MSEKAKNGDERDNKPDKIRAEAISYPKFIISCKIYSHNYF
jgi:hypothetical protein